MPKILITRPEHDDTTHYLSHWSRQAIDLAEKKGIKVFDLHRENANRQKFNGIIQKQKPNFVIFMRNLKRGANILRNVWWPLRENLLFEPIMI